MNYYEQPSKIKSKKELIKHFSYTFYNLSKDEISSDIDYYLFIKDKDLASFTVSDFLNLRQFISLNSINLKNNTTITTNQKYLKKYCNKIFKSFNYNVDLYIKFMRYDIINLNFSKKYLKEEYRNNYKIFDNVKYSFEERYISKRDIYLNDIGKRMQFKIMVRNFCDIHDFDYDDACLYSIRMNFYLQPLAKHPDDLIEFADDLEDKVTAKDEINHIVEYLEDCKIKNFNKKMLADIYFNDLFDTEIEEKYSLTQKQVRDVKKKVDKALRAY
jgi:hypothetical protein